MQGLRFESQKKKSLCDKNLVYISTFLVLFLITFLVISFVYVSFCEGVIIKTRSKLLHAKEGSTWVTL